MGPIQKMALTGFIRANNECFVEGNVAIAASDAGIYVGQSKQVVVRNNRAEYNVAGTS